MRKGIVILASVTALMAVVVAVMAFFREPPLGPVYRGKTLSQWLDDRYETPEGTVVLSDESIAAVQAIGPDAIPHLLQWVSTSESIGKRVWFRFQCASPQLACFETDYYENNSRASHGFRALGSEAKPAFPKIVDLVLHTNDDHVRCYAINSLTEADDDTAKLLITALKHGDLQTRLRAADALAAIRISPDIVVPALKDALLDPNPAVRAEAASGISLYKTSPRELADTME